MVVLSAAPMDSVVNGPSNALPRAAKEAQLMVNPWNAMYNDRFSGGMGDSVGNRAAATGEAGAGGGPGAWNLAADKYRWEGKFIPGASQVIGTIRSLKQYAK